MSALELFKGIALFTPAGDLFYCVDPNKQNRWHLNLCIALQEMLGLPEPPHFLVPRYTATVDRWLEPTTQEIRVAAEAYPSVLRYQPLLNAVFKTEGLIWQPVPWHDELCDPVVLSVYRQQFPQLWENHNLVVQLERNHLQAIKPFQAALETEPAPNARTQAPNPRGYVLRLFVSGRSAGTERTLQNLYQLLEQSLNHPYTLKVVDISKYPEQAEIDQVSATPTLVKVWPRPVRRIVGDLENVDQLLRVLGSLD